MIDVVNLQRKIRIDLASVRKYIKDVETNVGELEGRTFSVALVSDGRMQSLNSTFRGKDSTTDVLSFPHEAEEFERPPEGGTPHLGDVVISAQQAERQAKENKLTLELEIKQLILHGVLHLCGYDHETDNGEMNVRELELRELLNV
jgi:probable rRNA maturation factor